MRELRECEEEVSAHHAHTHTHIKHTSPGMATLPILTPEPVSLCSHTVTTRAHIYMR